jgi:hypothetical protein
MISARAGSDLDSWQRVLASLAATAFGVAFLASAGAAIAAGPFDGLSGRWAGNGTVTYDDGTRERLTCTAKYDQTDPNSISQVLACRSSSYNFRILAYYKSAGTKLTGHWSEQVLQIEGSISGSVANGLITGTLHGPTFQAAVVVDTNGTQQTVTITNDSQSIRNVAVAVKKNG